MCAAASNDGKIDDRGIFRTILNINGGSFLRKYLISNPLKEFLQKASIIEV